MTHRILVDLQTGMTTQVEYTPEEQAIHDAAVAAQAAQALADAAQALAEAQAAQQTTTLSTTP